MKFGRFEQQGRIFYGIVEGDQVSELDGSPFESHKASGRRHALSTLRILVPCTPSNFYCAGLNYAAHIEWGNKRKGTNTKLSEADALSCVLGYTLGNDLSERTWQKTDRTLWRAKNCDTWKPMGPFIATGLDPMNLTVSVRVNGEPAAEYSTGKMLFSCQHFISKISQYMTLYPGDVIWLGTDNATEPDLKHGDTVEIAQKDIGMLRNPVVRAQ